jgi:hypothetical protein
MFLGLMRVWPVSLVYQQVFSVLATSSVPDSLWKTKLNSCHIETKLAGKILKWEDATNRPKELPVLRIPGDLRSFGQDLLAKDVGPAFAPACQVSTLHAPSLPATLFANRHASVETPSPKKAR